MLSSYEIDPVRHIVVVAVEGEVTDENCVELHDCIRRFDSVRPEFARLIDLREARGTRLTSAGVRALAERPLSLPREARRAVVVPSILGIGMVRMYDLWRGEEHGSLRIFRDFDEARDWLAADAA